MSIRITSEPNLAGIENAVATTSRGVEAEGRSSGYETSSLPPASDHVDLSSASNLVTLARQSSVPGRPERLASLAARVGSGHYRPSSASIAQSVVRGVIRG